MKKYFIQLDGKSVGPFSIDELKILKVTPSTPVWIEGEKEWRKANEIKELQALFISSFQSYNKNQSNYSKPKNRSTDFANFTFDEADASGKKTTSGLIVAIVAAALVAGGVFYFMNNKNLQTQKENAVEGIINSQDLSDSLQKLAKILKDDSTQLSNSLANLNGQEQVAMSSQDLVGSFDNNAGAVITVSGNSDQHLTVTIVYDFKQGDDCKGEISGDGKRVEDEEVLAQTFHGCELTLDYNGSNSITVKESKKCKSMHGKNCSFDGVYRKRESGN